MHRLIDDVFHDAEAARFARLDDLRPMIFAFEKRLIVSLGALRAHRWQPFDLLRAVDAAGVDGNHIGLSMLPTSTLMPLFAFDVANVEAIFAVIAVVVSTTAVLEMFAVAGIR